MNVLAQLFKQMETTPIWQIMRNDEQAAGFTPVLPGEAHWFSADDWRETDVVSTNGREVRIVAIVANKPGTGAFSRMVRGIIDAGLVPVVVEPFEQMEAILTRWGWKRKIVGRGVHRQETWRPN